MIAVPATAPPTPVVRFPVAAVPYRFLIALPVFADPADPAASRAAAALAAAEVVTRGKGLSYVVTIDPEAAGVIWQQALAAEGEPGRSKSLGAALRDIVARINKEIRGSGWTYPTVTALPAPREFVVPINRFEDRRNHALFPNAKHWTGALTDHALIGGPGEPTRTPADMRIAIADLMERYLALHPLDSGPVHQATIAIAATHITSWHYATPGTIAITRETLIKYIEFAEAARTTPA